jgi:hypothetical protein
MKPELPLIKVKGYSLFSVETKRLVHQIAAHNRPAIPKGLNHSAQGWPIPRGLPWVTAFKLYNPEGVEYQSLGEQIQPLQGCDSSTISPRVARSSQPWAARCNPVGIAKSKANAPKSFGIPLIISRNQITIRNGGLT